MNLSDFDKVLKLPVDTLGVWHLGYVVAFFAVVHGIGRAYKYGALNALWIWVMSMAIINLYAPWPFQGDVTRAFQATSGQVVAELILIPLAICFFRQTLWKCLPYVVWLELILVWVQHAGLLGWQSFDLAFVALAIAYTNWWTAAAAIITMLFHHDSTAILMVLANLAVCAVMLKKVQSWQLALCTAVGVGSVIIYRPDNWFGMGERLTHWAIYMGAWSKTGWPTVAFGFGPGSFMWLSMLVDKFKAPLFLQMHNEYLQITFENGAFGLVLLGLVIRRLWLESRGRLMPRAGLASVLVFGLTYHPLRFFPSAMLCAMVVDDIMGRQL